MPGFNLAFSLRVALKNPRLQGYVYQRPSFKMNLIREKCLTLTTDSKKC